VLLQAVDGADKGRLARTRRTTDDDDLPLLERHTYSSERMEIAIPFVHISTDDDILAVFEILTHPLSYSSEARLDSR
jgi:hypothetical protein